MRTAFVVAMDENGLIGRDNDLPGDSLLICNTFGVSPWGNPF